MTPLLTAALTPWWAVIAVTARTWAWALYGAR